MQLPSSKNEPQWLQYFKLVILELQNVTIRSVFLNQVTNSTFDVSRIVDLKSFDIHYTSFLHAPYKLLPSNKSILCASHVHITVAIYN